MRSSPLGSSSTMTKEPGTYPRASNSLGIGTTLLSPIRRIWTILIRAVSPALVGGYGAALEPAGVGLSLSSASCKRFTTSAT